MSKPPLSTASAPTIAPPTNHGVITWNSALTPNQSGEHNSAREILSYILLLNKLGLPVDSIPIGTVVYSRHEDRCYVKSGKELIPLSTPYRNDLYATSYHYDYGWRASTASVAMGNSVDQASTDPTGTSSTSGFDIAGTADYSAYDSWFLYRDR